MKDWKALTIDNDDNCNCGRHYNTTKILSKIAMTREWAMPYLLYEYGSLGDEWLENSSLDV